MEEKLKAKEKNSKQIPMWQVMLVFGFMIGSLFYTVKIIDGWVHIPLILSGFVAAMVAMLNGYTWDHIEKGIVEAASRTIQGILIMFVIGMVIGVWIQAGIVPAMVYYGLKILSPGIFLLATCIICAIVSLATGSSWTTAATVGVALIGVGSGLEIPLPIVAGAIISGAYFGDKMSPLSDTTNVAPAMAGANLFDHIRHMLWTTGPSFVICLIIYGIMGLKYAGKELDVNGINTILTGITDAFYISPLLLIPPALVILMVVYKVPALPGLFGGVILGGVFAIVLQGASMQGLFYTAYQGYIPELELDFLNALLERGGIAGMYYTTGLMLIAMILSGVMEQSGMLHTIADKMLRFATSTGSLVLITLFSCIFVNLVASEQYLSIVIPCRMYKDVYEEKRLKMKNLSRVLEDGGTLSSPLIPWTTCGAYMYSTLGVHPFAYLPYAFLNLINPVISVILGYTGISMEKMSDEEYDELMQSKSCLLEA